MQIPVLLSNDISSPWYLIHRSDRLLHDKYIADQLTLYNKTQSVLHLFNIDDYYYSTYKPILPEEYNLLDSITELRVEYIKKGTKFEIKSDGERELLCLLS